MELHKFVCFEPKRNESRPQSESADLREFAGLIMAVERNEEYLRKENQELIEQWRCAFPLLNSYTNQK